MKISIKREQNQASLSFAERLRVGEPCSGMRENRRSLAGGESNFRPQVKNKLFLLLALLLTAATGAWADKETIATNQWQGSYTGTNITISVADAGDEEGCELHGPDGMTISTKNGDVITQVVLTIGWYSGNAGSVTASPGTCSVSGSGNGSTYVTITGINASSVTIGTPDYYASVQVSQVQVTYEPAPAPTTYSVKMKDGTQDAKNWSIASGEKSAKGDAADGLTGLSEGQTVTLQYNGRLKVKGVKATSEAAPAAPTGNIVDLATLTADYEAQDGETLTGTLAGNYKISIADGATVTLDGVTINGVNDGSYEWAGITCDGDATIILSGTNTVKGFYEDYPGIQAAADKTLIINGTGSLTASSYSYAAAIGGGNGVACGNIEIQGGTITATSGGLGAGIGGGYNTSCGNITISGGTVNAEGGNNCAGIGGGYNASWGNITISGGTVNATGGEYGAGIGGGKRATASFSCGNIIISGGTVTATGGDNAAGIGGGRGNNNKNFSSCGDITITTGVTKVTATMGEGSTNSIGAGKFGNCGTVTIGGVEGAITTSPYTYDPTAPAKTPATVTTAPTGAAIVGVGKTTALVSGGAADGGTLMYKVTTENTKPASTDGFSDAVPTAETITASGTVYVWYYVKGDDTHSDSEIAATAIEVPVAIIWDATNVTDLMLYGPNDYGYGGVTLSGNAEDVSASWFDNGNPTLVGIAFEMNSSGGFTFTAPTGKKFTKIEMNAQGPDGWNHANLGEGWKFNVDWDTNTFIATWKGSAATSTVGLLTDVSDFGGAANISYIAFYLSE